MPHALRKPIVDGALPLAFALVLIGFGLIFVGGTDALAWSGVVLAFLGLLVPFLRLQFVRNPEGTTRPGDVDAPLPGGASRRASNAPRHVPIDAIPDDSGHVPNIPSFGTINTRRQIFVEATLRDLTNEETVEQALGPMSVSEADLGQIPALMVPAEVASAIIREHPEYQIVSKVKAGFGGYVLLERTRPAG